MKATSFLFAVFAVAHITSAQGADAGLGELEGRWSVRKTNDEGRVYSQNIEIAGNRLKFELRDSEGETRFIAEGRIKAERAGDLKLFVLDNMDAGRSRAELEPLEDRRTIVYTVRGGQLILASNFDKERDNERPNIDVYTREKSGAANSASATPVAKLLGTWKMDLTVGDDVIDYELEFKEENGQLKAVLISPRSGRRNFKTVSFSNGQLSMEIDREIEGQPATLRYTGKLTDNTLGGRVTIAGDESRSATWNATR